MDGAPDEPGLPPHDDAVWADLARRRWRRRKWRAAPAAGDPADGGAGVAGAVCAVFGTPIHRAGTYYLRPAYTDGERWLSQRGYEALQRRLGRVPTPRRYGRRPPG